MPEVRSADLCWGQRYHWLRYQQVPAGARHDAHIVTNYPLPQGLSLTGLRSALAYLVRRHEGLRTVFDAHARPGPRQRVEPPGPMPLLVAATEQDGTPGPAAVIAEMSSTEFDPEREWPIRACAVTTGGVPRTLALVLNHTAFDDWSMQLFQRDFEALLGTLATGRRAQLGPVAYQPADLAAIEARPSPERAQMLRYWQRAVSELPADMFVRRREPAVPDGVAAFGATLTSPALLPAVREIAARLRVWPSAVHLAAYAVAMATYTGERTVTHRWLTSHRQDGPRMSVLTCMFSPALVSVDLGGDPGFAEVVARVAAALETAQEHAYAPYDEIVELVAQDAFRRGAPIRTSSEVNFLNHGTKSCGTRKERLLRTPEPTAWALSETDTYLRVGEWDDGVTVGLNARADVMDAAAVEHFLRGYGRLLEAHRDAAVDLRLDEAAALFDFTAPAPRRLARLGPDAVDLDATERVLLAHPAVRSARVSVEDGRLLAEVTTERPLDERELRLHCLDTGSALPGARRPDLFRVTAGEGARAARTEAVAADALAAVVAEVNGLAAVDLDASYTVAGGRMLRAPRVLTELRARGWEGADLNQLGGTRPLSGLAHGLTPVQEPTPELTPA
ncbi:condensation domain-containing protein [Streptomyces sp. NPDC088910]|uniref:condensation domain-containing protein n=1 Tax=Streptomyces sp. NPDC088910 TaxID=3365911 RepID=UPI00382DB4E3